MKVIKLKNVSVLVVGLLFTVTSAASELWK
jgi:hypothetical protein